MSEMTSPSLLTRLASPGAEEGKLAICGKTSSGAQQRLGPLIQQDPVLCTICGREKLWQLLWSVLFSVGMLILKIFTLYYLLKSGRYVSV